MTPRVFMLPSTSNFGELVRLMHEKRVSAIIIFNVDDGQYYIISHTDVIEFLHKFRGEYDKDEMYSTKLSQIMNGPIDIVEEKTPIDQVIRIMTVRGYKRVLIGKNGEPTGIVSTRDLLLWNNNYFKEAAPLILMVMDNDSSIILGKHVFRENFNRQINHELIDLYGGALTSISHITEEVLNQSGGMRCIRKDNFTILFEPREMITAILVCDHNSIMLRRRLNSFTSRFEADYSEMLCAQGYPKSGKPEIDLAELGDLFRHLKL